MREDELLTIYSSRGVEIGTKPRSQVHRDGDWHMLVFVLAARRDMEGRKRFLLQVRDAPDDPYRGQVDVLAGGHVAAKEGPEAAALREVREEAGLRLGEGDLVDLGTRRLRSSTGVCRRVIQRFYLLRRPVLLDEPTFSDETSGFLEVELGDFALLMAGRRRRIRAAARMRGGGSSEARDVTWDQVSAYSRAVHRTLRWCLSAVSRYLDRAAAAGGA